MLSLLRFPVVFTMAGAVTVTLFQAMNHFVAIAEVSIEDRGVSPRIEFARSRADSRAQSRTRALPQRLEQQQPPEMPPMDHADTVGPNVLAVNVAAAPVDTTLELTDVTLGARVADADEVPIVRVEPIYPMHAREKGLEGWVLLRFDILSSGRTENVVVVDSKPLRVFNRAAVAAVKKWKYRPRVVNSEASVTRGVKVKLAFSLDP